MRVYIDHAVCVPQAVGTLLFVYDLKPHAKHSIPYLSALFVGLQVVDLHGPVQGMCKQSELIDNKHEKEMHCLSC